MAYRVKTSQEVNYVDPITGEAITYVTDQVSVVVSDPATNQQYTFNGGDEYPDWAYAEYSNPRVIEETEG